MIVIDASSLTKYILHEDGWRDISVYMRERRPLYSIDHVVKEVGNAIWKHCYLSKVIGRSEALKLYQGLVKLLQKEVIILRRQDKYLEAALQIALNHGITLYDSLYLAQAKELGELLTSDKTQANIASQMKIKVHLVT